MNARDGRQAAALQQRQWFVVDRWVASQMGRVPVGSLKSCWPWSTQVERESVLERDQTPQDTP